MPVTETIRVDRERFMFLVAALATASCGLPRTATQPSMDNAVAGESSRAPHPSSTSPAKTEPESRPSEAPSVFIEAPTVPRPEPDEPDAPVCDNEVGEVDCSAISSTCESMQGACDLLARHPYRPRVAEAIASCWARIGHRACNIRARQACNLEGIRHACLDPAFEPECEANIQRCLDAGARVTYTVDECVQVLSSLNDEGERSWASGAMGPTREGCKLMFPVY